MATRTRRSRKAGTTPSAALKTIRPSSPDSRRQYGLNSGPMRRRFARRTAGSAGRSGGASDEWKNMPISGQGTSSGTISDVRVTVRLFAGLRERAGAGRVELDGVPRVSGGAFLLSAEPLDVARVTAEATSDGAGAVATFVGTVRRRSRGRDVVRLEYEAFEEMAEPMLRELAGELKAKHGLCEVAIHHRVGPVDIGEASVVIAVSAPHRAAALDACREAIDTLKETIPLWKKEIYADGEEWIGRGS